MWVLWGLAIIGHADDEVLFFLTPCHLTDMALSNLKI
jgi:hypothetical protein